MSFLRALIISALSKADVEKFSESLEAKHGVVVELRMTWGDHLVLDAISVPKTVRGAGHGSKVMEEIIKYADQHQKIIALDPSTDFGASSVSRLKTFYSRFGFVSNSGRNKDFMFRQAMIRYPKKNKGEAVSFLKNVSVLANDDEDGQQNEQDFDKLFSEVQSACRSSDFQSFLSKIKAQVLKKSGLDGNAELRRAYDGNSQISWLIEKMIGEYLSNEQINN